MAQYETFALTKDNALGYGCMGLAGAYGNLQGEEATTALLQQIYAAGYRHFDTAEMYRTFGEPPITYNEEQVGNFLKTIPRESFTVATKFWPLGPGGPYPSLHDGKFDLATVTEAVDGSLKRLGLDYVDLYYIHRLPDTAEQLDEWMMAVKELVAQGKIRHVGLSEPTPNLLRRAHAIHPIAAIQQEWSLATRGLEDTLVPVCRELGITIVAYSPLGRNLLAAEQKEPPTDRRANQPRFQGDNFQANQATVQKIRDLGQAKGWTSAQLSLAWLWYQAEKLGVRVLPIPGSTRIANVTSNIAALNVKLTDDEAEALAELGKAVQGARNDAYYIGMSLEGKLAAGL